MMNLYSGVYDRWRGHNSGSWGGNELFIHDWKKVILDLVLMECKLPRYPSSNLPP